MGDEPPLRNSAGDEQPITIRLWSSRWAWVNGVIGVALGIALLGAPWLMWYVSLRAESPEKQGLMVGGSVAATPGLVAMGCFGLAAALRLLRPRRGRIDVLDGRLVVHDRWMLRRPMLIHRADVTGFQLLRWKHVAWRLPLSDDFAARLRQTAVMLDYGTTPNVAIHFREPRVFPEAVRAPLARVGFDPISRGRSASSVLIRVADPEAAVMAFDEWMAASSATGRDRTPTAGCLDGCLRVIVVGLWAMVTIGGLITYGIGSANEQPRRPDLQVPP